MRYGPEMVTALLGVGAVLYGFRCGVRIGRSDECSPSTERAAYAIMGSGAVAVLAAYLAVAWFG